MEWRALCTFTFTRCVSQCADASLLCLSWWKRRRRQVHVKQTQRGLFQHRGQRNMHSRLETLLVRPYQSVRLNCTMIGLCVLCLVCPPPLHLPPAPPPTSVLCLTSPLSVLSLYSWLRAQLNCVSFMWQLKMIKAKCFKGDSCGADQKILVWYILHMLHVASRSVSSSYHTGFFFFWRQGGGSLLSFFFFQSEWCWAVQMFKGNQQQQEWGVVRVE